MDIYRDPLCRIVNVKVMFNVVVGRIWKRFRWIILNSILTTIH